MASGLGSVQRVPYHRESSSASTTIKEPPSHPNDATFSSAQASLKTPSEDGDPPGKQSDDTGDLHDHSLDPSYPPSTPASAPPSGRTSVAESNHPITAATSSSIPVNEFLEGGYGWVVVFACAYLSFWFIGIQYTWGVVQLKLVQQGLSNNATLAFVGSLCITFISILAIPNASLIVRVGAKRLSMMSVTALGGGAIFSSWACRSLGGLFFTFGIVMGIGMSFNFMVVSSTPSQYFSRKKGLATGVVFAGGGLGGAILSPAIEALLDKVGVAWTFRILGLIILITGLPTASLIREAQTEDEGCKPFRDPRFLLLFLAGAIGTFPLFVPAFFLPSYASTIGLSSSTGAGLVACYNLSSAIGRLCFGQMCDSLGALNSLALTLALSGVSMLAIWPVSKSLAPLIIFSIINGSSNGGFFSVIPSVVGSLFGLQQLPVALGMTVTGWMAGYLLGAPIAGYLLNAFGGAGSGLQAFRPAMYYAGGISLLSLALVLGIRTVMGKPGWAKV